MTEPRVYTGWKAGLLVVFAVVALMVILNVVGARLGPNPKPSPGKVVTTVTPAPS